MATRLQACNFSTSNGNQSTNRPTSMPTARNLLCVTPLLEQFLKSSFRQDPARSKMLDKRLWSELGSKHGSQAPSAKIGQFIALPLVAINSTSHCRQAYPPEILNSNSIIERFTP